MKFPIPIFVKRLSILNLLFIKKFIKENMTVKIISFIKVTIKAVIIFARNSLFVDISRVNVRYALFEKISFLYLLRKYKRLIESTTNIINTNALSNTLEISIS